MPSAHWQIKSEPRTAPRGHALTSNGIAPLHRMLHAPATIYIGLAGVLVHGMIIIHKIIDLDRIHISLGDR